MLCCVLALHVLWRQLVLPVSLLHHLMELLELRLGSVHSSLAHPEDADRSHWQLQTAL